MIQWMLAIWSLVPLPFLKPAWTSGSSWFTYCWSLAWRILSITLLACVAIVNLLNFSQSHWWKVYYFKGHCVWLCAFSCLVVSDFFKPVDYSPPGSSCPWNCSGKNIRVGCHFLLQGVFPAQESNMHLLCLLHWQVGSSPLSHRGYSSFTNVDLYSVCLYLLPSGCQLRGGPCWMKPLCSRRDEAIFVTCFLLYMSEAVSWLLIPCRWSVIFSISFYFHFS